MKNLTDTLSSLWGNLTATILSGAEGLGIYVDKRKLTLVQVQKNLSGIKPEFFRQIAYKTDNPEEVLPALRETIQDWKSLGSPVSLAVSSDFGFFQKGVLPIAASENLVQVVAYELDRFLPLPASDLYYTFHVVKETDQEIHFMFLAVPRQRIERWLNILKEAGLRPVGLELAPCAAANAALLLAEKKFPPSWLLLHTMTDGFELTQINGRAVNNFSVKREIPRKDFIRVVQTHLARIVAEGSGSTTLCVYGKFTRDMVNRLSQEYEFEVVHPGQIVLPESPGQREEGESLTAVGAALTCLGKPSVEHNLLPLTEREPVSFRSFSLIKILFCLLVALGLIWAGSALIHKRVLLFQINRQIAAVTPEAREVEGLIKEGRALAQQMENLRNIGASPDTLLMLRNLTQIIPQNTWLYSVRLSKQVLEIGGMSQSASELIPLLEKSGWLKKTEFVSPIVTDANKLEHFKIKAEIKGLETASR
ncbi:PilN domain-containing protein [Desulfobacca acetoxidans]|uniref:Fimbrial assembly family protein n=1 Tax=Desulfobacca acetoxidans (strain ATCC 700848 / DSM 11109 / ASRB2) TaxID=880072 RepID=F2NGR0_DESAR|nr:PilN domain-containing protein [Desulfobacca acetoxidans]AEB08681.1 Fimbrial assembly family protein [Desulfobacca acetoxidans DSM 11109]